MRPSRRRGYLTNVIAVIAGLVCVTAIASDLTHGGRPRDVFVAVTAGIDPSPTTTVIADSDVYGMTQADVDKTMDTLRANNITAVRLLIPWAEVEPTQGALNWATVDKTVNSAASRNLAIVGVVNSTPRWAVGAGGRWPVASPASPAA